jgi:hypothetical protein
MSETKPFIPGFQTVQEALKAGQEFYAKTNGAKGQFQRDFHIVANEHGQFHFAEGQYPSGVDIDDRPPSQGAIPPTV